MEEEKGGKKGQSKQSLTILEWRNGVVKEWVMDSKVEEPSIGGACSAMIHRFKCIPGWVRLVESGIGSAGGKLLLT